MEIVFHAIVDVITQPVVLFLLACPVPFYVIELAWSAFHVGGNNND